MHTLKRPCVSKTASSADHGIIGVCLSSMIAAGVCASTMEEGNAMLVSLCVELNGRQNGQVSASTDVWHQTHSGGGGVCAQHC